MAVTVSTNKVIYNGDDVSTVFPYSFKIYLTTDLVVKTYVVATETFTTLVEGTDYSVSGAGEDTGGNVTLLGGALATGTNLIIRRVLPKTQLIDMQDNEGTPADTFEEGYDRAVMLIQELQEQLDRAVIQDEAQTTQITFPSLEAGKWLTNDGTDVSWGDVVETSTTYTGDISNGADADKSASPTVGDIYVALDTKTLYVCFNGTAWSKISILVGNDADKAASPQVNDLYFAVDTEVFYFCASAGVWSEFAISINGLTAKSTPADNDVFMMEDSAASYAKKKIKYSELGIPEIQSGTAIQTVITQDVGPTTITVTKAIPADDTKPQSDEGIEYTDIATVITPSSSLNTLIVDVRLSFPLPTGNGANLVAALFKDIETDARAVSWCAVSDNSNPTSGSLTLRYSMVAGGTSAITFKVRVGYPAATGAIVMNEMGTGNDFGDLGISSMMVTEIKA